MIREYRFLIGGEWRRSEEKLPVKNPYNGKEVGIVNYACENDLEDAVTTSQKAFEVTRGLPAYKRARVEVSRAINTFKIALEEAKRIGGKFSLWI